MINFKRKDAFSVSFISYKAAYTNIKEDEGKVQTDLRIYKWDILSDRSNFCETHNKRSYLYFIDPIFNIPTNYQEN